jgi:cardiolipin synthase
MNLKWLPNAMSLSRSILSIIVMVLALKSQWRSAFALLVVAQTFDAFDGWLARKLDAATELGQMLDKYSDRAMLFCTIVGLMFENKADLIRNVSLFALAAMAAAFLEQGRKTSSEWIRRVSGTAQISYYFIAVFVIAAQYGIRAFPDNQGTIIAVGFALALVFLPFKLSRAGDRWAGNN